MPRPRYLTNCVFNKIYNFNKLQHLIELRAISEETKLRYVHERFRCCSCVQISIARPQWRQYKRKRCTHAMEFEEMNATTKYQCDFMYPEHFDLFYRFIR